MARAECFTVHRVLSSVSDTFRILAKCVSYYLSHIVTRRFRVSVPIEFDHDRFSAKWRIVDTPRGKRRLHSYPVTEGVGKTLSIRNARPIDPWFLREEFLKAKTESDILEFLDEAGQWHHDWPSPGSIEDFAEWQQIIRKMLLLRPRQWGALGGRFDREKLEEVVELPQLINFSWTDGGLCASVSVQGALEVLVLSVYIDHLRAVKFKICARPDCEQVFPLESKHKRKYCNWDCAHVEAVRRARRNARTQPNAGRSRFRKQAPQKAR